MTMFWWHGHPCWHAISRHCWETWPMRSARRIASWTTETQIRIPGRWGRERHDENTLLRRHDPDRLDPALSQVFVAAVAARLPLPAHLFGLCPGRHRRAWRGPRHTA